MNVSLWHSPISNFGKPAPLAEEALRAVCGARANAKASPIQALAIMETAGDPIRGRRVPWFTTMAPPLSPNDTVGRRFIQAAKVSVLSARRNAPSLSPYLLYYGDRDEITDWMEAQGVKVLFSQLSFFKDLPRKQQTERAANQNNYATYGKLDVPLYWSRMITANSSVRALHMHAYDRRRSRSSALADGVLYTDLDVIFMGDVTRAMLPPVRYLAGIYEKVFNMYNTGVLWMNVSTMVQQAQHGNGVGTATAVNIWYVGL